MKEIAQDLNTDQIVGHYKKHIDKTYIGAHDLMLDDGSYREVTVTIKGTHKREIFNPGKKQTERRVVATFEKGDKHFIMNATNLESVGKIAGTPMVDKWQGVTITLFATQVQVGKQRQYAIRVKAPS